MRMLHAKFVRLSVLAGGVALLLASLCAPPEALAERAPAVYALVVGIDEYRHIPPLQGAVNDARDISDAIGSLPDATVVTLLNGEATREAIFGAWHDLAAKVEPGDRFIFTFAGHGSNEPAVHPETETDGKDEVFLLAGFTETGPGAGERIRDDEIAALLETVSDATAIVVADSCHSGTATRQSLHDLSYRFYKVDGTLADPLPLPPPPAAWDTTHPAHETDVLYFGAVADDEKAPEFPIHNQVRGALSAAFADALRGAADGDGDRMLTKGEVEVYVRRFVNQISAAKQHPQVAPPARGDWSLVALDRSAEPVENPFELAFDDLPVVEVRSDGPVSSVPLLELLTGVTIVGRRAADVGTVIVDQEQRTVRSGRGDLLTHLRGGSQNGFVEQLQDTVNVMRVVNALQAKSISGTISVWFPTGDELYVRNEPVSIYIEGRSRPYTYVFSIGSDGTMSWLYPINSRYRPNAKHDDPLELDADQPISLGLRVGPPFGTDHVVVIETEEPNDRLGRTLNRHNGSADVRAFWDDLRTALDRGEPSIAIKSFFTTASR